MKLAASWLSQNSLLFDDVPDGMHFYITFQLFKMKLV